MAKIMLVEDDNNLREIYEARLLAEGYEIIVAKDGEEALALAVKERPDLVISDVMMPKISGFDMLDILRGTPETKDTKVIMMTALSQAEDKARGEKLGADRYLVKSQVTLEDVAKVAREVLESDDPVTPSSDEPEQTATAAPAAPSPNQVAPTTSTSPDSSPQPAPEPQQQAPPESTTVQPDTNSATQISVAEPPVQLDPTTSQPVVTSPDPNPATPDPEPPQTDPIVNPEPTASAPDPASQPTTATTPEPNTGNNPSVNYTDLSQIIEDEQADANKQIQDFIDKPVQPTPTTPSEPIKQAPLEQNVGDQPATEPPQPAQTTTPSPPPPQPPRPEIANKKIIKPLDGGAEAKDLGALLAEENKNEAMGTAAATTIISPDAKETPLPPPTESNQPDPNSNPGNVISPSSQTGNDPNNIAL